MKYNEFISINCTVKNKGGLHARPSTKLCEICSEYKKAITIKYKTYKADAKSVLSILSLGIPKGSKLEIIIENQDKKAKSIAKKIYKAFKSKFK